MGETIRFGVSMDSDLVEMLDSLSRREGHENRSETLRGLVRQELVDVSSRDADRDVIGTVTLLYHYETRLPRVSVKPFPSVRITANMQLHAENEICVKVLVVKGKGREVHAWAQKLLSGKKVIGKLTITATDELFQGTAEKMIPGGEKALRCSRNRH